MITKGYFTRFLSKAFLMGFVFCCSSVSQAADNEYLPVVERSWENQYHALNLDVREKELAMAEEPRHPNVVVFLADDQGWGDLSMNGNKDISTPHIDSIARNGATFTHFYVSPVCSPTRAEFLTGRYHGRSTVYGTSAGGERMDSDEITIADIFKAAGYKTAAFGKWHSGMQFPYHPNARGFDEFYGFCSGHWGNYYSPMLERNNRIVKGEGFVADDFTGKAIKFIEANKDKPFFVYVPYCTPHSPMQVPDKYWDKFKDKKFAMSSNPGTHTRAALAMCENIDDNVGLVLKKLKDLKLDENTIVIYFSDNGPNGNRWNGDMLGQKGSCNEGGVRSPFVMQWPGKIKAGKVVTQISGSIDLLPTLVSLCGIPKLKGKPLDGISMKKAIMENPAKWPDRYIFSEWSRGTSIRNQKYRLDKNSGKLYDIKNDQEQNHDLSAKHPEIAKEMMTKIKELETDIAREFKKGRPFVITHPDSEFSQIPARDVKYTGRIKRSNKFPNCSYLTNWVSTDDYIFCNAEVAASGDYEAVVYYTCAEGDTGCELELSFGEGRVSKKVTEAHAPPLIGRDDDRHKRGESYVKDFKPLSMGTINLQKGTGTLKLKSLSRPGKSIIEFRLLTLRKVK